ncbi:MAG: serine hydrolase [Chitinophagaceae bacterium]
MAKTFRLIGSTFLFFFSTLAGIAQVSSLKIDSLMEEALTKLKVAGAAIAVVKDGKVIHQKGYGVGSIDTKVPVTERTNFQIASNTKAFTTAALSILVDEGKIKWDDKVKEYIPEFKMYNEYVTNNFNIVDLLTHRSGLGLGAGDLTFLPDESDFTVKDVVHIFQHFKPTSAFRTKYNYDNLLYIIAGEIIARVSSMSYEEFVQKRILQPLQMANSFVGDRSINEIMDLATPHSTATGSLRVIDRFKIGMISAAGGMYSNVADMSKWAIMQLHRGKYGDSLKSSLFSYNNSSKMWTIQTVLPNYVSERYNTHFNGYGLGWLLNDMRGNLIATHTGGLPGMLSQVTLVPDLNLGIIILTNTESGGAGLTFAVTRAIMDSYFGLDDAGWIDSRAKNFARNANNIDEVTKQVWRKVDSLKNTRIESGNFIGMYEDKWFGKVEVFLKGKQLWMKSLRSPKLNGPMYFYSANTFAIKWQYQDMNCDAFATFSLPENGKATSIKMKGISPGIDFSFDFQDLDLNRVERIDRVAHPSK